MENTTCQNEQLELEIRAKRRIRFKAGAELSSAVSFVGVDMSEDMEDDQHIAVISIRLNFKDCTQNH